MTLPAGSVWVDAQGAQSRAHSDRGIARYIIEQLRAIMATAPELVGTVGLSPELQLPGNTAWLLGSGRLQWTTPTVPDALPTIFHIASPLDLEVSLDAMWPSWARNGAVATVVTLYDLIPLVFQEHYLKDPRTRAGYMARLDLVRRADQVLAISQATACDAAERLGVPDSRITVIDAGVAGSVGLSDVSPERALEMLRRRVPGLRAGFALYVGGIEYRKNVERLIEAHAMLAPEIRARHQLVITCSVQDEVRAALESHGTWHGLRDGELIITGHVEDSELAALYRSCRVFVFPSLYEGSGLPILEAMSAGAPVLASNTSTSPEILGGLEGTFDPFSPADISRAMALALVDDDVLDRLRWRSAERVTGYTWDRVALQTLKGYEAAHARRPARRRTRSRIALVSPWPPEQSGIADYNQRLVGHLSAHIDVDVVVSGAEDDYVAPTDPGVRIVPARTWDVGQRIRSYDRVLYCMGNSSFHGHVYEALQGTPGAVVAHDVRLTGFYGWLAGREHPEDPTRGLAERIRATYGDRVDAAQFVTRPPSPEEQQRVGIYMTAGIQERAQKVLVHSQYAAEILRLDRVGKPEARAEVAVIPFGFPEPRPRAGNDGAFPLIVTVGVVSSVKGLATLLDAFALVRRDHPDARLVIGGPGSSEELRRWRSSSRELGLEDAVEVPGHLSRDRYDALLSTADVAVQLRDVSNGEASASVADCLAAGVPTVATAQGWVAELPADVLVGISQGTSSDGLAVVLTSLLGDDQRRERLTASAQTFASRNGFAEVARAYLEALALPERPSARRALNTLSP